MNFEIITTGDQTCNRCGGEAYLTVKTEHPAVFRQITHRTVMLCPRCDADDPNAQALLALYAFHSQPDADAADDMGRLVPQWVEGLRWPAQAKDPNHEGFAADMEAYERGDFD